VYHDVAQFNIFRGRAAYVVSLFNEKKIELKFVKVYNLDIDI